MNSLPLVSVILPVFNGANTLKRAIDSILSQSLAQFELIVINNGSTDHSDKIIASYNDPRVLAHELPEPNLVIALNYGIKHARGKYIARMDADDTSLPDRLLQQSDFLNAHPGIGVVSGKVLYTGDRTKNLGYALHVDWANRQATPDAIYLSRFQDCALPHPSVMFRKSIGHQLGFYRAGNFPEDFELWNRWLDAGIRMAKIPAPVLEWHDSASRLSRTHPMYLSGRFDEVKALYFSKWLKRKFTNKPPLIYVWGTGSAIRKKTRLLKDHGLSISRYIDVKPTQAADTIHYTQLNFSPDRLILNYVSDRKGKQAVYDYLIKLGYEEGKSFYMMQ